MSTPDKRTEEVIAELETDRNWFSKMADPLWKLCGSTFTGKSNLDGTLANYDAAIAELRRLSAENAELRADVAQRKVSYENQAGTIRYLRDQLRSSPLAVDEGKVREAIEQACARRWVYDTPLRRELFNALRPYLLPAGTTPFRWIPVSERMPTKEDADQNGDVLIYWKDGDILRRATRFIDEGQAQSFTHWSPIPPLPVAPSKTQEQQDEEAFEKWFRATDNARYEEHDEHRAFLAGCARGRETKEEGK